MKKIKLIETNFVLKLEKSAIIEETAKWTMDCNNLCVAEKYSIWPNRRLVDQYTTEPEPGSNPNSETEPEPEPEPEP